MLAIFKREFKAYFYSPIAYVLASIFFAFASFVFFYVCVQMGIADISSVLMWLQLILLIIFPILTMKVFADEKKNNTEVLLLTSPTRVAKIVIGKYLAVLAVFLLMCVLTLAYVIILFNSGSPNGAVLAGSYLAFILFGAGMLGVNFFIASFAENQVIAALLSFFVNVLFYFLSTVKFSFGIMTEKVLSAISPIDRTAEFWIGKFSIDNILFFVILIALMLSLTVINIEKKRWN